MDLIFEDAPLEQRCARESASVKTWGPKLAAVVRRRLIQMTAAETLAILRTLPFCILTGQSDGSYIFHTGNTVRIMFTAVKPDGSPACDVEDENVVREVRITAIETTYGD